MILFSARSILLLCYDPYYVVFFFFFFDFFDYYHLFARLNLFIIRLSFSPLCFFSLFFLPPIYQRRPPTPASGQSVNRSLFTAALCARLLHPHILTANNLSFCRLTGRLHKTTLTSQSPHHLVGSQVCGCRYRRPCSRQSPCA